MKKISIYCLFLFLLGFVSACNDSEVAPTSDLTSKDVNQSDAKAVSDNFLKAMKFSTTLSDGSSFAGNVTITNLSYDGTKGLLADGFIQGEARTASGKKTQIRQNFTGVEATLASGTTAAGEITTQATCQILFLDLGPIFLDVLGLQVDLSQIVLDISAVSGTGNLLGNLLCAVAGLLDPGSGLLTLIENLGQLLDLLEQINAII
jgi:hypothetical protein